MSDDKHNDDDRSGARPDPLPEVDVTEPAPGKTPTPVTPAPRRRGGFLAVLALLLALAAAAGTAYLYYQLIHLDADRRLAERVAAVETERDQLARRIDEVERRAREQQAALETFRDTQEQARAETERALRQSLNAAAAQAPPTSAQWQRAEVHYLLRVANHRLRLERDVPGALQLLQAADAILTELDDFALFEVRARLSDEIAALETVEGTDLQGLFLRLEALKRRVDALPLRLPIFSPEPAPAEPAATEGWWSSLVRQIGGYLRVRQVDEPVKPLLTPEQAGLLELNLRLMLERTQLAALRREQALFEDSLAAAVTWIDDYLDLDEPVVAQLRDELIELQAVPLDRPLPDVSGSLNALRAASRPAE
jgi:uroporphyrin-III C-methyltransferase